MSINDPLFLDNIDDLGINDLEYVEQNKQNTEKERLDRDAEQDIINDECENESAKEHIAEKVLNHRFNKVNTLNK
jgi:hypothetical protein